MAISLLEHAGDRHTVSGRSLLVDGVKGMVMDYSGIGNLATAFFDQADRRADQPFLWAKRDGSYRSWSWQTVSDEVCRLAAGLVDLGVCEGDRVVIVSENRPEWVVADLAVMAIGALSVPTYTTNTTEDTRHIIEHSGACAAIVSTDALMDTVQPAAEAVPECAHVIMIDEGRTREAADGTRIVALSGIPYPGSERATLIRRNARDIARDALCCLIYTSGTGGRPKGVMLTHASILANCAGAHDLLAEIGIGDETFLSLLPLSHAYEHTAGLMFPITIGAQIYYAEGPDRVAQNLQEARPTIMTAVPRLYEVLHERIRRGVDQAGGLRATMFHQAVATGRRRIEDPGSLTVSDRLLDPLLDRLVRRKVAARFGGRLKAFVSGGAALNRDVGLFFLSLGVRILQGYGQTETSPIVSCNRPGRIRIETVGPPFRGVELRIADDGEILVRGELLMKGYWRDQESTDATIVDGWLHTGDIGVIDADGALCITDRKKDIIVNSGGDTLSPARVEGFLTLNPDIAQAMVSGDRRPWLAAVVVPSEECIDEWASRLDLPDLAALADDDRFQAALADRVNEINATLSPVERVRRIIVASEPFTTDNGLMTPTLKVRRHKVLEIYGSVLDRLYDRTG